MKEICTIIVRFPGSWRDQHWHMFGMYHNSDRVFRHSRGDSGIQLDHSKLVSTNVFIRVREGRLDFGADEDNRMSLSERSRTIWIGEKRLLLHTVLIGCRSCNFRSINQGIHQEGAN